jgi:hypothetical protein
MYKIYIDSFEIYESQIDGFDSLNISKGISERYHGYWNADGFGFSESSSNDKLTIKNIEIAKYIKDIFNYQGFSAEVPVKIINTATNQESNLLIDFSTYAEIDCCYVSFSLRPLGGGDLIKARDEVQYPIQLTEDIQVPIRELPNVVNFKVQAQSFTAHDSVSINHNIPLIVTEDNYSDATSNTVGVNESSAFFISKTEQCVSINGSIKVNVLGNNVGFFDAYFLFEGQKYLIDTFPINNTLTEQTITINATFNLDIGDELKLIIEGGDGFAQFTYDSNSTGLNIKKCETTQIVWKNVKAISLKNAFKSVISQMTGGKASLGKYYFDNCFFDSYITNNDGLQGNIGRVNVSLFKLFDELNNKFPTSINVFNSIVDIISRCEFYKCENQYQINIKDIEKEINQDLLYSSVKVGYNNWQGDSSFSSLEYNGKREYVSSYALSSKSLSLLNDWSASSSIITSQILKNKEKEEIHWIIVNKSTLKAEIDECITSNVFDSDRAINIRITPTRNLQRHSKFLLNSLKFASGEGNYNFASNDSCDCDCYTENYIDETQDIVSEPIFGKFIYKGTVDSCEVSLDQLKGCVIFEDCGVVKNGFIKNINYKTSQTSNETIDVEIIEFS